MKPSVDRIDFRQDQSLDAADLAQASSRAFDLLALHTARGHGAWGVANGYGCRLSADGATVLVDPGIAYDNSGRALLNPAQRRVALPPVTNDRASVVIDLVAWWPQWADLLDGCGPCGMPIERAALRWEPAGETTNENDQRPVPYSSRVHLGIDIPIARLTLTPSPPARAVDTHSRPVAHALVRPKLATGYVQQSSLAVTNASSWADWSVTVSTDAAGFDPVSSPVYFVTLDSHPFGDDSSMGSSQAGAEDGPPDPPTRLREWAGPFVSIARKNATAFTVRVVTIPAGDGANWARNNTPATNPVPISWLGVSTPDPDPFVFYIDPVVIL